MATPPEDRQVEDLLHTLATGPSPEIRQTIDARVTRALWMEVDRRERQPRRTVSRSVSVAMAVVAGVALSIGTIALLVTRDEQPPVIVGASSPVASATPSATSATSPVASQLPGCGPAAPIQAEATPFAKGMSPRRSKEALGDDVTIDDLRAAGFIIPLPDVSYGFTHYRIYRDDPEDTGATVLLGTRPIDPHEFEDAVLRDGGVSISEWKDVDGSFVEMNRTSRMGETVFDVTVGPYPAVLKQSYRWVREQFLWEVWWHADGHDYQVRSGLETAADALDVARSMVCGNDLTSVGRSPAP